VTCGLILAAGESRRMGSPKPLLQFQGETFLDRLIGLFSRRCSPVIVVLGAHRETVRAGLRRAGEAVIVENPDFARGQLSSMQCGLRVVPAEAESVLFTLVDHPAITPATIDALLDAPGAPLAIARFSPRTAQDGRPAPPEFSEVPPFSAAREARPLRSGRRGHPILIAQSLLPEFLALPHESSAREVIARYESRIAYLDVDDPGVLADVDDPAAYAQLIQESAA